ncbi:reverse transcriptase [Paramuricea clavata]|uniref:Reverse transcriptase n=1 Tax=Paramuricea clavata TaxID=317549 RepID=A0A7D9EN65_PARCT|nr:reverse transcriptase [Paramuricea clavata]
MVGFDFYEFVHRKDITMVKTQLATTASESKEEETDSKNSFILEEGIENSGNLCPGAKRSFLCRMKKGAKADVVISLGTNTSIAKTKGTVMVDETDPVLSKIHWIAEQLDEILNGKAELPQWITYGRTVLCLKDPSRGNTVDNFRPISCLRLMWKLMTGLTAEGMYTFVEMNDVLPNEQKGCRRKTRGTKDQFLIDKLVLRDCKRRHTNLSMAWIDYRKAYDMVPHSWIVECLSMFKIAANVRTFVETYYLQ